MFALQFDQILNKEKRANGENADDTGEMLPLELVTALKGEDDVHQRRKVVEHKYHQHAVVEAFHLLMHDFDPQVDECGCNLGLIEDHGTYLTYFAIGHVCLRWLLAILDGTCELLKVVKAPVDEDLINFVVIYLQGFDLIVL